MGGLRSFSPLESIPTSEKWEMWLGIATKTDAAMLKGRGSALLIGSTIDVLTLMKFKTPFWMSLRMQF